MAWFQKAIQPLIKIIMITHSPEMLPLHPIFVWWRSASLLPSFVIAVFLAAFWSGAAQASGFQAGNSSQTPSPVIQIQKDTLVVGSEQDYPPFATGMTDATAGGFTVDLWKEVASEAGLSYTIRVLPFRDLLQEFKEGRIDVLINLAQSEERHRFADFTVPHVVVHGAIFVRKGDSNIRSEDDFAGKSIIVLNADLAHDYALSKGWGSQLVLVNTAAEGLRLLASGKCDAMLLSKLAGMQTLQAQGLTNIEALKAKAGFSQKFAFAVSEGQSELLGKLNEGLALTKTKGAYSTLYDKWFGLYEEKEVGLRDVLKYLIPVVVVFLLAGGYFFYRRKIERQESDEKLRTLYTAIEQSPISMVITDVDANIEYVNPRFSEVTGYTSEEAIGQNPRILQSGLTAKETYLGLWSNVVNGQVWHGELVNKRKSGETYWEEVHISPVKNKSGVLTHYVAAKVDITQRKQVEEALQESEQRYHFMFNNNPMPMWVFAEDSREFLVVNDRVIEHYGFTREEFGRMTINDIRPKEDIPELDRVISRSPDGIVSIETRHQKKDGTLIDVAISTMPMRYGGIPARIVLIEDITERKHAEKTLRESESRFRFMLENSPIAIRISNRATCQVVFSNQRYAELIGLAPDSVIGINPKQYYANPQDYADVIELLSKGGRVTNKLVELLIPGEHSKTKWALASYLQLEYQNEPSVLGWFYDISDRKAMEEQVQHLAHYDALTDLPNRTLFADRLQQALAVAKRDKARLALMFIDLDKFKPVNDALGHNVGDMLLKEVSRRIQACLRESDTVARVGGDEFIVLLPAIDTEQDALGVAEKIRSSLNEPFDLAGHSLGISSSTGIV
ncbi:MAG: PAS domain S-box protein, partial [Gallionellaceae bacterium]